MNLHERAKAAHGAFVSRKEECRALRKQMGVLEGQHQNAVNSHAQTINKMELLTKAIEAVKKAVVPLTERGLGRMKELMTFGLNTIFEDRDYSVEIEVKERGNDKTAIFWLIEGTGKKALKVKLKDAVGGGVRSVIGLILRVFFVLHYRDRRILLLDEPLGDLADKHLEGVFKFLRYCIEDLQFRVLMVTHDTRFKPFADRLYRVSGGEVKEVSAA